MNTPISNAMPVEEMGRLDFLVGEFLSLQTLRPAGGQPPVQYECVMRGSRETCDRYLKAEFFSDPPGLGVESATFLHGYHKGREQYELYGFLSSCEEPMRLEGHWEGRDLVLVSSPVAGVLGLQRFRQVYTPVADDCWDFVQERWEPHGYVKYISGRFTARAC